MRYMMLNESVVLIDCEFCDKTHSKHMLCKEHVDAISSDRSNYIPPDSLTSVEIPDENSYQSNKYMREVLPGVWIDVYDVIDGFEVSDGGYQHAIKKMLATGQRGHKDEAQDRKDVEASIKRSNLIYNRKLK